MKYKNNRHNHVLIVGCVIFVFLLNVAATYHLNGSNIIVNEQFAHQTVKISSNGYWTTMFNMPTSRFASCANVVNGKIYVIGGTTGSGQLNTVEAFDPLTNTWTTGLTNMPTARSYLGGISYNGRIYAIGGTGGISAYISVERYDPFNNTWTTGLTNMPTARSEFAVAQVNGIIYAIGGQCSSTLYNAVEAYNISANTWTTGLTHMPTTRTNCQAAVVNGIIYVFGGFDGNAYLNTVEAYNPKTNTWTTGLASMPEKKATNVVSQNNLIYVMGGYTGSSYSTRYDIYDPTNNTWTTMPTLIYQQAFCGVATYNNKFYVIGGQTSGSGPCNYTEVFTFGPGPVTNWITRSSMPTARYGACNGVVMGKIYIIGGFDGSGQSSKVEAYDSSTDTWATNLTNIPTARSYLGGTAYNGRIYAIGGTGGISAYVTVERYDPFNNTWTSGLANMPTARSGIALTQVNGIIYAIGGQYSSTLYNTVEAYNISANTWTTGLTNMPTTRTNCQAAVVNGIIYVIGGYDGNQYLNTVEAYNPKTNSWTTGLSSLPEKKDTDVVSLNGTIYAVGGYQGTNQNSCEAYSPINNTWWHINSLTYPRGNLALAVCNYNIYSIGGGAPVNYNEEFVTPSDWTNSPPICTITTPTNAAIVNGTISIQGTASDPNGNSGLVNVEIMFDTGSWNLVAGTTSWSYQWHTTSMSEGNHTIYARALDNKSAYSTIYSIQVKVANDHAPVCAITYPTTNQIVNGTILIQGISSDPDGNSGLVGVSVKIDSGSWNSATGTTSWSLSWNSKTVLDGTHFIYARALDNKSVYSTIMSVKFNVSNNHAPICIITYPANFQNVTGIVTITGTSSDPDGNSGIVGVALKFDGSPWYAATGTTLWSYQWDSKSVSDGLHAIYARTLDNNSAYSVTASVNVNTTNDHLPICVITSPTMNQSVKGTITVLGTSSDPDGNASLVGVEVQIDSGSWISASGTTSWQYQWNSSTVSDGLHNINARSVDNQSRYSTIASVVVIVGNNFAPTCSIISPKMNDVVKGLITITGVASDLNGNTTLIGVEIKIDSLSWVAAAGTVSWNYSWDTTKIPDGLHTIQARSLDNTSIYSPTSTVSVTVKNDRAPTCIITSPSQNQVVKGIIAITGSASDSDGNLSLVNVEVKIDSGSWRLAVGTVIWSYQWDTQSVADGAHMISARSLDNMSTYSPVVSVNITIQNFNPPSCSIGYPAQNQTLRGIVYISGNASDLDGNNGLVGVEVRIDSGNWVAATGTVSWLLQWDTNTVSDGTHNLYARALDNTSLYSTISTVSVIVQNDMPPTCRILSPSNDTKVSGAVIISVNATDDKKVANVEFMVDNNVIGSDSTSPYSLDWDSTTVSDGMHNISAMATDNTGKMGLSTDITILVYNNVADMRLGSVTISPEMVNMTIGNYTIFSAQAYDIWNQVIPATYTWSVYPTTPSLGILSYITTQNVIFMGTSTGTASVTITASYNGITKTATASVNITSGMPNTFVILGTIKDSNGVPIANATVRLDSTDNTYSRQTLTNDTGVYVFKDVPTGKVYRLTVIINGQSVYTSPDLTPTVGKAVVADIQLKPTDTGLIMGFQLYHLVLLLCGLGVAGAFIALLFTEAAKYAILSAVFVPLYSRLKREETLDHFVRGQVFEHIRNHPGTHYNEMKKKLKINNGSLAYHLRILELQGFVKAVRQGLYKRFYEINVKDTKGKGIRFSKLQTIIVKTVNKQPGMSQSEIARKLDIPVSVVNYNIRILIKNKAIRIENKGSKQLCFAVAVEEKPATT